MTHWFHRPTCTYLSLVNHLNQYSIHLKKKDTKRSCKSHETNYSILAEQNSIKHHQEYIIQRLDSIIHRINHFYPVKNTSNFVKISELDGDFSDGKNLICQQLGPNLESAPQYSQQVSTNRFQPIAYLHPPFYKLTQPTVPPFAPTKGQTFYGGKI